jgi:hypothetical protein
VDFNLSCVQGALYGSLFHLTHATSQPFHFLFFPFLCLNQLASVLGVQQDLSRPMEATEYSTLERIAYAKERLVTSHQILHE